MRFFFVFHRGRGGVLLRVVVVVLFFRLRFQIISNPSRQIGDDDFSVTTPGALMIKGEDSDDFWPPMPPLIIAVVVVVSRFLVFVLSWKAPPPPPPFVLEGVMSDDASQSSR